MYPWPNLRHYHHGRQPLFYRMGTSSYSQRTPLDDGMTGVVLWCRPERSKSIGNSTSHPSHSLRCTCTTPSPQPYWLYSQVSSLLRHPDLHIHHINRAGYSYWHKWCNTRRCIVQQKSLRIAGWVGGYVMANSYLKEEWKMLHTWVRKEGNIFLHITSYYLGGWRPIKFILGLEKEPGSTGNQ